MRSRLIETKVLHWPTVQYDENLGARLSMARISRVSCRSCYQLLSAISTLSQQPRYHQWRGTSTCLAISTTASEPECASRSQIRVSSLPDKPERGQVESNSTNPSWAKSRADVVQISAGPLMQQARPHHRHGICAARQCPLPDAIQVFRSIGRTDSGN